MGSEASLTPQEARDDLAHQFLVRAAQAAAGSREQDDFRAAAWLLDRDGRDHMNVASRRFRTARVAQVLGQARMERDQRNEITAAERRFRVTQIERVVRMDADDPEPPRPSDFDPPPTACG